TGESQWLDLLLRLFRGSAHTSVGSALHCLFVNRGTLVRRAPDQCVAQVFAHFHGSPAGPIASFAESLQGDLVRFRRPWLRLVSPALSASESVLVGHEGGVDALAVLPDGRVVSVSGDKTVRIWDERTGQETLLGTHESTVTALAVLPDGRVVSGSFDQTLQIW